MTAMQAAILFKDRYYREYSHSANTIAIRGDSLDDSLNQAAGEIYIRQGTNSTCNEQWGLEGHEE